MLTVENLEMEYSSEQGPVRAVRGVSFTVEKGNFYTLLGPSGCGKTSTLRCIAGLETPTSGKITIGDDVVYDSETKTITPTHKRAVGMVFQSYAIWPHMTVFENVSFPLTRGRNKVERSAVKDMVSKALDTVQLAHLADRPAPALSGGQQQRVALARAIVYEPDLLLLDEPLSNLDAKLRDEMRQEIKEMVARLGITTLYVTHDQVEALAMSDQIAVMYEGIVVQEGPPQDVYLRPTSAFTANFVGKTNVITGQIERKSETITTQHGSFKVSLPDWAKDKESAVVAFRPEAVTLAESKGKLPTNTIRSKVFSTSFVGEVLEYILEAGEHRFRVKGDPFLPFTVGQDIDIHLPADRILVMPSDDRTMAELAAGQAAAEEALQK